MQRQIPPARAFSCTPPTLAPNLAALRLTCTLRKWKPLLPPKKAGGCRPAPRLRAIVVRPAACSVGASPAAPLGGIRQHEQVQTGEQEQGEREHYQEA